jgi:DNA/RNA endonuclease G (NUC1)
MLVHALFGVSVGAVAGVAAAYTIWGRRRQPETAALTFQAPGGIAHPALRYGAPVKERIRVFSSYVASFDPATRNPSWTIEHLSREKVNGDATRAPYFTEDLVRSPITNR